MSKNGKISALLLFLLLCCFAAGLYTLFILRFEAGDVFPAYSSLRSDPLGAKALYQALEQIPSISVGRSYRSLSRVVSPEEATVLCIGESYRFLSREGDRDLEKMHGFVERGGRLVVAFRFAARKYASAIEEEKVEKVEKKVEKVEKDEQEEREKLPSASQRWEAYPEFVTASKCADVQFTGTAVSSDEYGALPIEISIHTALYFSKLGPEWCVLYAVEGRPVVIERPIGGGSLVLVADSYLFSNEAMRDERHPELLAWTIGSSSRVLFDEYHLGVIEQPGLMGLIRKYRLHGLLAALALLAGLFVWRNGVVFVPTPAGSRTESSEIEGRSHLSGLINLLRRNIRRKDILGVCFNEWQKSLAPSGSGVRERMRDKLGRVEELLSGKEGASSRPQDILDTYRRIAQILSERSGR